MPETPKASSNFSLKLYVGFSMLGLAMLQFLLLSIRFSVDLPYSNFLVGLLFCLICVLGVTAVFYPKNCQGMFTVKEWSSFRNYENSNAVILTIKGHHPNCTKFNPNRIKIRETVLCSACSGLFLGAIFALVGAIAYFFFNAAFPIADVKILLGSNATMVLGLIQFKFSSYSKLIVNAFFVIGSFITLVIADSMSKNLFIDLYVLGLIIFFLLLRIQISEWNNRRICLGCENCSLRQPLIPAVSIKGSC